MRIAFAPAARVLSDTLTNGESLIAAGLLRALAARGHEVLAYCERNELAPIDGVEVREIPVRGVTVGLARLAWARAIARDLATERADLAHVLFPFNTHEGYAFVRSIPVVVGPVNLPWPHAPSQGSSVAARAAGALTRRMERRAHARTIAEAARILITGESARAPIPEHARPRCDEVPFGVDIDRFLPRPMPQEPTILFLSSLLPHKGIEVLIRAMPAVVRRIPRARLVVAGADPMGLREQMADLAHSLGVASDVSFHGEVPPARTPGLLAEATVLCQPSLGEPFGMTVIEAMAAGRPVVGTAAGGIPDALVDGEGGRLVAAGDERSLADALCSVLESPEDALRMGAFNRARAVARYALANVVDRIESVYREVAVVREGAHVA